MLTVQASFTQLAHKASLAVLAPRPQLQNGPSNPPISLLSLQVSVIQLVLPASVSILAPQASMTISGHPQSGPSRPQLQNCNCFVSHLGPNGPPSLNCYTGLPGLLTLQASIALLSIFVSIATLPLQASITHLALQTSIATLDLQTSIIEPSQP